MNSNELRQLKDKAPYDNSMECRITFYDNMPYMRDISVCTQEYNGRFSGNIIKFYRYKLENALLIKPNK